MVEFFTGLSTCAWGIWLLAPGDAFALSRGLALLGNYAPENVWGAYFASVGALLLVGALLGRKWPAVIGAFLVMWGRLFLALLAAQSTGWGASSIPDYTVWALMALISTIRALGYGR